MEDSIIVYSLPTCGMCRMLKRELEKNNIVYENIQDPDQMSELGITNVPILSINGTRYKFKEARDAVKYYEINGSWPKEEVNN